MDKETQRSFEIACKEVQEGKKLGDGEIREKFTRMERLIENLEIRLISLQNIIAQ